MLLTGLFTGDKAFLKTLFLAVNNALLLALFQPLTQTFVIALLQPLLKTCFELLLNIHLRVLPLIIEQPIIRRLHWLSQWRETVQTITARRQTHNFSADMAYSTVGS